MALIQCELKYIENFNFKLNFPDNVDLGDVEIELARLVGDNQASTQNMEENSNENPEVLQMSFMEDEDEESEDQDGPSPQPIENIQSAEDTLREGNVSRTIDGDVEMTSDADESSSASANNSRSFSPNYSPNHQQNQAPSDLNMLNREQQQQAQTPQPQMNISQQEAPEQIQTSAPQSTAQPLEDQHMRGDTDPDSEGEDNRIPQSDTTPVRSDLMAQNSREFDVELRAIAIARLNEAFQAPLPSDDTDEDDEDEETDEQGAVGGAISVPQTTTENQQAQPQQESNANTSSENQTSDSSNEEGAIAGASVNIEEDEGASGIVQQEIDPAIRLILGDIDIPEGIDPSFLAALPSEMREEVINEHTR